MKQHLFLPLYLDLFATANLYKLRLVLLLVSVTRPMARVVPLCVRPKQRLFFLGSKSCCHRRCACCASSAFSCRNRHTERLVFSCLPYSLSWQLSKKFKVEQFFRRRCAEPATIKTSACGSSTKSCGASRPSKSRRGKNRSRARWPSAARRSTRSCAAARC